MLDLNPGLKIDGIGKIYGFKFNFFGSIVGYFFVPAQKVFVVEEMFIPKASWKRVVCISCQEKNVEFKLFDTFNYALGCFVHGIMASNQ